MPVEEQLLPNPALKPIYDDVVWVHVYNDFKKGDADRAATRTRMRLGVSSWPQLLLVEPDTLRVVGETGREVEGFLAAVRRVRVKRPADPAAAQARLVAAERLAATLEQPHAPAVAVRALASPDVAVQVLAVESLRERAPAEIAKRAVALLATPNDLVRYAVCTALETTPAPPAAVAALEALVREPTGSRNPNVLRIHAARALGGCGTRTTIAVLQSWAAGGDCRNGLTGVAVDAVRAIGERDRTARADAVRCLAGGFPAPVAPDDPLARACSALVKRLHGACVALTGRNVPLPDPYDAAARARLAQAFGGR